MKPSLAGAVKALLRLYEGSIKALLRLYEGSLKALLRRLQACSLVSLPYCSIYVSSCYYTSVLLLLHTSPHTSTYAASYWYIRRRHVQLSLAPLLLYICVLMLLHICPHTSIYVASLVHTSQACSTICRSLTALWAFHRRWVLWCWCCGRACSQYGSPPPQSSSSRLPSLCSRASSI